MEVKLFESINDAFELLKENEPRLVRAGAHNICIVRHKDQLMAFKNECPHQGAQLHQGVVNYLGEIVCPLHAYRFNLATGEPDNRSCGDLKFVSVVVRDAVYLEL